MDQVVSVRALTARSNRYSFFETDSIWLRSSSRIGPWTYPFHRLNLAGGESYRCMRSCTVAICRQHAIIYCCVQDVISKCYHTTSKLCHCSTSMVRRKWTPVKPRQIGSSSIFAVSACQGTFCNFNYWLAGSIVALSSKIKLVGVTLDGNLNFNDQIKNVRRASLFRIRALCHIRLSLTEKMATVVACALVQSRVDYANSLYIGHLSSVNFDKLQLMQNIHARVVTLTRKRDHIQPSLKRLHWLPIRQRVDFKVALLTYSIRHSREPQD